MEPTLHFASKIPGTDDNAVLSVFDVPHDSNGDRPTRKVFTFPMPSQHIPSQTYYGKIDNDTLARWWTPIADPQRSDCPQHGRWCGGATCCCADQHRAVSYPQANAGGDR